jgi:hypothetical protein
LHRLAEILGLLYLTSFRERTLTPVCNLGRNPRVNIRGEVTGTAVSVFHLTIYVRLADDKNQVEGYQLAIDSLCCEADAGNMRISYLYLGRNNKTSLYNSQKHTSLSPDTKFDPQDCGESPINALKSR